MGNGLRVVTGAVITTGGSLAVATNGRMYNILPQNDGSSLAIDTSDYDHRGTSIHVKLGIKVSEGA